MGRIVRTALAAVALAVLSGAASAQGWGLSFGFGDPYVDPYYHPEHRAYPPPVYYGPPPLVIMPGPPNGARTVIMVSPEEVEEDLLANGFSRLGPIEAFEGIYQLTAADPGGNLVALTVSMRTGQIEMVEVLEEAVSPRAVPRVRRAAPARPAPKVAVAPKAKPSATAKPPTPAAKPTTPKAPAAPQPAPANREPDPLVVY